MRTLYQVIGTAMVAGMTLLAGCDKADAPTVDTKAPTPAPAATQAPLIQPKQIADWCPEHGVPESVCTRCNSTLIAGFKQKGDWCATHDLPDSQCLECHPELKAKFEAMKPKS